MSVPAVETSMDVALDRSMIPLGSCTMKLNATSEMIPVTWPEFSDLHPFAPPEQTAGYAEMIKWTTKLNTPGIPLGRMPGVHALTAVTGFGLLGHLLEICRGSNVEATVDFDRLPLHPGVLELAREGFFTGASGRNWAGYGKDVALPKDFARPTPSVACSRRSTPTASTAPRSSAKSRPGRRESSCAESRDCIRGRGTLHGSQRSLATLRQLAALDGTAGPNRNHDPGTRRGYRRRFPCRAGGHRHHAARPVL